MKKKVWPTDKVMSQIYELNLWGTNKDAFYSGNGSHDAHLVKPYLLAVTSFLKSFKTPLVVADLGCGDFNIGKQLQKYTAKYIAVDIVEELITYNKNTFIDNTLALEFKCLDISQNELPKADVAILRQVLQHLSNSEILNIVAKLYQYKYIILTEHIPSGHFIPNENIISGQGIRIKKKSGVDLQAAPFNLKTKHTEELLHVELDDFKGKVVTSLYVLQ